LERPRGRLDHGVSALSTKPLDVGCVAGATFVAARRANRTKRSWGSEEGLAVDDTIHFMHNFRRYFDETGDVKKAVRRTMQTTGQAMLFTSIVLSLGFFIYLLAGMLKLRVFGFLTGATILLAFVSDAVLAPALMTLVAKQ
jgi:hypothetical protein